MNIMHYFRQYGCTKMGAEVCISDCSLLNQTTCQPVSRRQLVTVTDQVGYYP